MGQTYSVDLRFKCSSEDNKKKAALAAFSLLSSSECLSSAAQKEDMEFVFNQFTADGLENAYICITPEQKVWLDTHQPSINMFEAEGDNYAVKCPVTIDGFTYYNACFDGSYGWESMLYKYFMAMVPYLEPGSSILVYPDSGHWKLTIDQSGHVIEE